MTEPTMGKSFYRPKKLHIVINLWQKLAFQTHFWKHHTVAQQQTSEKRIFSSHSFSLIHFLLVEWHKQQWENHLTDPKNSIFSLSYDKTSFSKLILEIIILSQLSNKQVTKEYLPPTLFNSFFFHYLNDITNNEKIILQT